MVLSHERIYAHIPGSFSDSQGLDSQENLHLLPENIGNGAGLVSKYFSMLYNTSSTHEYNIF